MNNTLEEINSRITEAEEWMNSDLENRMLGIIATEQNLKKKKKGKKERNEMKTVSETSGDMHEHSHYRGGSQKEKREGKT